MELITFSLPASVTGNIVSVIEKADDREVTYTLAVVDSSPSGQVASLERDYYAELPSEIAENMARTNWVRLVYVDGVLYTSKIIQLGRDNSTTLDAMAVAMLRETMMELRLIKDVLDADTILVDDDTSKVVNKDGIVVQQMSVVEGVRSSALKTHSLVWIDGVPEYQTTGVQDTDGNWEYSLTQDADAPDFTPDLPRGAK